MGVLAGLRVVEFDGLGPVPHCGMLLADHGADLVRIVRPGPAASERLTGSAVLHRGRPTLVLDLKAPEDRARALALVAAADALMEGFRPGVMERLGLGPDECRAVNPRLVYGRMTGWGQTGPLSLRAGHDIDYIARSGALAAIGPAGGPPVPPLNLVGDYAAGSLFLAFGLLAGVLEARRTGRGRVVDAAICDAVPPVMALFHAGAATGTWSERRGANLLDGGAPFYRCYPCADGGHVAVGALEPQFFRELMQGLELDPGAHEQMDEAGWPALAAAIGARFLTRPRDAWAAHFRDRDACVAPVLTMTEARADSHMVARGAFLPDGTPAPAPRFDGPAASPGSAASPGPAGTTDAETALARWRQRPLDNDVRGNRGEG